MADSGGADWRRLIGQVFCINLARRADRWAHSQRALCSPEGLGLDADRLQRVDACDLPAAPDLGRAQSHRRAFAAAAAWAQRNRQATAVMICEDDMVFMKEPWALRRALEWCRDNPRRWGLVNLSAHAPESRATLYRLFRRGAVLDLPAAQRDFRECDEVVADWAFGTTERPYSLLRTTNAEGTGCYLVNPTAMSMLNALLFSRLGDEFGRAPRYPALMEQQWKQTQERVPFFMVHPRPAIQAKSVSDVLGRLHDYSGFYRQEFFVRCAGGPPGLWQMQYAVDPAWYDFGAAVGGPADKTVDPARHPYTRPQRCGAVDKSLQVQRHVAREAPAAPKKAAAGDHPLRAFGEWVMSLDKDGDGLIDIEYRTDPAVMERVQAVSEEVYARLGSSPAGS